MWWHLGSHSMIEPEYHCTCRELCRDIEQLVEQCSGSRNLTRSAQCQEINLIWRNTIQALTSESKHKFMLLLSMSRLSIIILASSVHSTWFRTCLTPSSLLDCKDEKNVSWRDGLQTQNYWSTGWNSCIQCKLMTTQTHGMSTVITPHTHAREKERRPSLNLTMHNLSMMHPISMEKIQCRYSERVHQWKHQDRAWFCHNYYYRNMQLLLTQCVAEQRLHMTGKVPDWHKSLDPLWDSIAGK